MEKVNITDSISETLFINIPVKANENRRPAGILKDPFSAELINKLDYDFAKLATPAKAAIGVVVRTQYFDEETMAFINRNKDKNPVVVTVGAGLDTRFLRINGNDQPAVFYELDLPDVMDLREKALPPAENEFIIKSSMFETAWMDELAEKHQDSYFLFVVEGVVFYFPEDKIKELFCNLAHRFSGEIKCDLINVWLSKRSQKNKQLKKMGATFDFGIDDEKDIETWSPEIRHLKTDFLMKRHPGRWGFVIGRIIANIPFFKNTSKLATFKFG
jgi:O-methyltransferase involved in polyketide biosynthesis